MKQNRTAKSIVQDAGARVPADKPRNKMAVIIINWNGAKFIGRSIRSALTQSRKPDLVIVVDNGSTDGSVDLLRGFGDQIRLICLNDNLGFAAANNIALKQLDDFDWVALLNPDAFAEPNWLEALQTAAIQNPRYSFFASMMVKAEIVNTLDSAGDSYHCFGHPWPRGSGVKTSPYYLKDCEVFSACAGAALYRREVLVSVGGLDESFFCYLEDVDLGFRLRLKGHKCLYVHAARVAHIGSGIAGKKSDFVVYYSSRNLLWVFLKNMPLPLLILFALPHLVVNLMGTLQYTLHKRSLPSLRGRWDGLRDMRRVWRLRKEIQATRTVGTLALLGAMSWFNGRRLDKIWGALIKSG